ncbi:MAG: hypothetical protein NT084_08530 [Bacteroidetes bacterium]|jgi:hypothetical protein|nr:hypothetical protein [Bacteroidota bacterium]
MNKAIISFFVFSFFAFTKLSAQPVTTIYKTKFIQKEVLFNGSPDPHECWESVANGIEIKTEKGLQFFAMGFKMTDSLKTVIGNKEVQIEVLYYSKPEERSGVVGEVLKITMEGLVIFKRD